jgi:tetratricopeptide (TPR) repeat protein
MAEEFSYQCQHCGTSYSEPRATCPYCGEPQPEAFFGPERYPEAEEDSQHLSELPLDYANAIEGYYHNLNNEQNEVEDDIDEFDEPDDDDSWAPAEVGYETIEAYDEIDDEVELYLAEESYLDEALPDDRLSAMDEAWPPPERFDDTQTAANYSQLEKYTNPQKYAARQQAYLAETEPPVGDHLPEVDDGEEEIAPPRFTWRRMSLGCLGLLICGFVFFGGLGILAIRDGLDERVAVAQETSDEHYQKGRVHLAKAEYELAIAEFEMAMKLNPINDQAREALREAQRLALSQPTPTSEIRTEAASDLVGQAQARLDSNEFQEALDLLAKARTLNPDYNPAEVSNLIYQANFQLGLELVKTKQFDEAQAAFDAALAERPNDAKAKREQFKASVYPEALLAEPVDPELAVDLFEQIFTEDEDYLDVRQRLREAMETVGDGFGEAEDWCGAEIQFIDANEVEEHPRLLAKIRNAGARCQDEVSGQERSTPEADETPVARSGGAAAMVEPTADTTAINTPAPAEPAAGPEAEAASPETATPASQTEANPAATAAEGRLIYSTYNPSETRWEILAVPAGGGPPEFLVANGKFPSLSPDGAKLVYRTERADAIGLHVKDLSTGEDRRVTIYAEHTLPRWGGSNESFVFALQEPGTGRWKMYEGFADGKGNPVDLGDGRTPAWSPDGSLVAYQGTDVQGNNPGIYLRPTGGGEAKRLTTHESDQSPAFSPDGSQLAYMSTRGGTWNIHVVATTGGEPRQITNASGNEGLPVWSPDGTAIAFVSDLGGRWGIFRVSAQGGEPVRVVDWDGNRHANWLMSQIWWGR